MRRIFLHFHAASTFHLLLSFVEGSNSYRNLNTHIFFIKIICVYYGIYFFFDDIIKSIGFRPFFMVDVCDQLLVVIVFCVLGEVEVLFVFVPNIFGLLEGK